MKDELQLKLVEILTSMQTAASKASDFAMAELPEIAQTYVIYGRWVATFYVAVSLLILVLGSYGVYLAFKEGQKPTMQQSDSIILGGGILGGVGAFVGLIFTMSCIGNFFLVWVAPKVWLLKEIAGLLK
jgi:hypothetical protein